MSIAVATPVAARKKPFAPQAARVGLYVFLTVSAIFFLLPLLLVAMNSLKSLEEIRQGNLLAFPVSPSFDAWVAAWKTACTGLDCNGVRPGVVASPKGRWSTHYGGRNVNWTTSDALGDFAGQSTFHSNRVWLRPAGTDLSATDFAEFPEAVYSWAAKPAEPFSRT